MRVAQMRMWQCMKGKSDWRECTATRDAMDACLEAGEQQRFVLDTHCNRWKRQYQSCVIEAKTENTKEDLCAAQMVRLSECVRDTLARQPRTPGVSGQR